jgi:hypothetical protein
MGVAAVAVATNSVELGMVVLRRRRRLGVVELKKMDCRSSVDAMGLIDASSSMV